ncbi:MAG: pyridoxal-phosphate dependent enzyme [Halanaerobiales bacterium]
MVKFECRQCGKTYNPGDLRYRCDCGGLFALKGNVKPESKNLTLGEGNTPLLKKHWKGKEVYFKMEYMMPTGSFKDRGAAFMIDRLNDYGVDEIIEDSSGNAGAAIAAYAAAVNMKCHIFIPEKTSDGKISQISAYGAKISKVPGDRDKVSKEVKKLAGDIYYASHIYNPFFFAGISTLALELKHLSEDDIILVPVGNGTMLLGLYYGFKKMGKLPRLIAVQAANCSPVYNYYHNISVNNCDKTKAEGIAVGDPPRKKEIIKAVKNSGGMVISVTEKEINEALSQLSSMGYYVETTAGVAPAGFEVLHSKINIEKGQRVVIPLTGSGLKK